MTTDTTPVESQWAIVARQFRKNRSAVWGLRITLGLVLIAIYAPAFASSQPFVYRAPGGETTFPWLTNLFDENAWQQTLDRLFNLLMVAVTMWGLVRIGLWVTSRFVVLVDGGLPLRRVLRRSVIGVTVAIVLGQVFFGLFLTSHTQVDYRAPITAVKAAEDVSWATDVWRGLEDRLARGAGAPEAAVAEARQQLTALDSAYAYRLEADLAELERETPVDWEAAVRERGVRLRVRAPEQARADLDAAREARAAYTIVRTPIPYGYRDQLPSTADKFRGFLDFDRGEVHLLGTDEIGRDIFARILFGTRISLTIGLVAVSIYITIGTILGALAGYFFNKKPDMFIMRLVEVMICIPQFFLLLTIVALFEQRSIFLIMFAIGLVSWTGVTRLVRGEFIRERNIEYVMAARAMGFRAPRILFRHILPNAMGPVLVAATFGVAAAILTESGLSFLGLGDVTVPSWGAILNHGRLNEYWHLIVPPSVAIFITVTALNLVGDGLRDALDPKLRD